VSPGAPRLDIRLDAIAHNARTLVDLLATRGIAVTGVTKAALAHPQLVQTLLDAGVSGLGDSRIDNIEVMRRAGVTARMTLIRSPMLSQVDRVVRHAEVSLNTEPAVIAALSAAAGRHGVVHEVVLMVELGDLREGILPADLAGVVAEVLALPGVRLVGLGTNLACRSGVVPDDANMAELSVLVDQLEAAFDLTLDVVSGGNSANLDWVFGASSVGRINDLRLGESILLGRDPLSRQPIEGLHLDAFTLVAEVIESKIKPSVPRGRLAQSAFGAPDAVVDQGTGAQTILAVGRQDVDPLGLEPPAGTTIVGTSSDHLVLRSAERFPIGAELRFQVDYSALLRAMTSPYVHTHIREPAAPLT
jgi:ornithine racemase